MQTLKDMLTGVGGGINKSLPQGGASASLPGMNGGIGGGLPQRAAPAKPTTLKEIIGIISDGMLGFAGASPIYGPAKIRQREEQDRFQQQWDLAERQGQQQRDNKVWEWQNKPRDPTAWAQNRETIETIYGPEAAKIWSLSKPVTGPDGITRWIMPEDITPTPLGGALPEGWSVDGGAGSDPRSFP